MERTLYEDKVLSLKCGDECDSTTNNKSMIQLEKYTTRYGLNNRFMPRHTLYVSCDNR